jgi:hypothetical protein
MRFVLMTAVVMGCGVSSGALETEAEVDTTNVGSLSEAEDSFVVLRRDVRRCASPMCGGYWLRDVTRLTGEEVYVSHLRFRDAKFPPEWQTKVTTAPDGEVVLRGALGPAEKPFDTRSFEVVEAFRGMPQVSVRSGDVFYRVERALDVQCIRAPCPSFRARPVGSNDDTLVHEVDIRRALKTNVDPTWLMKRATEGGRPSSQAR